VILLPVPPNPFHETRLAKELVVLTDRGDADRK